MTVVWQHIRFACTKCYKGHRVNTCTHIKRSLNELKTAGRPVSQCGSCRAKRAGQGHIHHKCKCGSSPPKSYREYYKICFNDGLELNLYTASNINIAVLQVQVQQNTPMEITIQKGNEDPTSIFMTPQSLSVLKEDLPQEEISENPCRCHFGGECICSLLPKKKKKSSNVSQLGGNLLENQMKNASTCACSSGGCECSSSSFGCQCNINNNASGQTNGCCSSTPLEILSHVENAELKKCCS